MRRTSLAMADKFRDIVARVGAVLREQREIDARRALQRYHHLLAKPDEALLMNEIIPAGKKEDASGKPTDLMRTRAPPVTLRSSARNFNIVAIVLTAALVTLQLAGLAPLERSHAHAMQLSFPREPAVCIESSDPVVSQIPTD